MTFSLLQFFNNVSVSLNGGLVLFAEVIEVSQSRFGVHDEFFHLLDGYKSNLVGFPEFL